MDLDDWTLMNVYFRPNDNADEPEKGYWPVIREDPDDPTVKSYGEGIIGYKQAFFDNAKRRGDTPEEAQRRWEAKVGKRRV